MRQYEAVWIALKERGSVRLAVPTPLHRRVIKAVLKEKYQDFGYRFQMMQSHTRLRLEYECKNNVITFTLHKRFSIMQTITLADL